MNIVQLHERVRFWVDIVASTRFDSQSIDNGINVAIDSKVRESYDQNRPMNRSDAFQRVQRIRDELGPLVKKLLYTDGSVPLTFVYNPEDSSYGIMLNDVVVDYGWLLSMRIKDSDFNEEWHPVHPISFDRKNIVSRNPFRRVRRTPESKCYYFEENSKWNIQDPFNAIYSNAEIYYLATPAIVNYGIEYDNTKVFTAENYIIAVEETIYDGVTYKIGDKIAIVAGVLSITSGLVVFGYIECDVRQTTHEEISRRAAMNCLTAARQYDKVNELRKEITAS